MKIKGKFQKKTKIIQPTNKSYPVLISDGINHGQKLKKNYFMMMKKFLETLKISLYSRYD